MKDFLGNELEVGDCVVLILPGRNQLTRGYIRKFNDSCVVVLVRYPEGGVHDGNKEVEQTPTQLVKILK